ncbi:MAG: TonB-dependent receptor [Balneola sp.]
MTLKNIYIIILSLVLIFGCQIEGFTQDENKVIISGQVLDSRSGEPVAGANVEIIGGKGATSTNVTGFFELVSPSKIEVPVRISAVGYDNSLSTIPEKELNLSQTFFLKKRVVSLKEITVSGRNSIDAVNLINTLDIQNRPVQNSQDILQNVPGLFIGQHAGGGKAEQIFLRGFDIDHGTDINLSLDGIPVNMVSHAHGQGYSDLHFIIPETISGVEFNKGMYYAEKGNFATAGYAEFNLQNSIEENLVKVEAGQYNSYRTVAKLRLLKNNKSNAYVAGEYVNKAGYFESSQDFRRLNFLGKYNYWLSKTNQLQLTGTVFESEWLASGQIPVRAVESGRISRFGAIDDTEGGNTSRYNASVRLQSFLGNDILLRNQVFYSRYDFELYSNFTFFLEDPVNGDQIRQTESRDIFGYKTEFFKNHSNFSVPVKSKVGAGFRYDIVDDIRLSRTLNRNTTLEDLARGDVKEFNANFFIDEEIQLTDKLLVNPSLRVDYFNYNYRNQLALNPKFQQESKAIISPKLITEYVFSDNFKAFAKAGIGFHSNDSRVVIQQNGEEILPKAYGLDVGSVFKPTNKLIISPTLWYLELEQEFVYVGDAGIVEPSGRTQRYGADLSLRYQITNWLYSDFDFNYTYARSLEAQDGEDYIPLAPEFTSLAGLSFDFTNGINGSLRYKYLGDRPATEDYSITAEGYFVVDAVLNYDYNALRFEVSVENLFDTQWNEAQFATESRLENEQNPVTEIHFTPGSPFFAKAGFSYRF